MFEPVDEFLEWCLLESSDSSKNLPENSKKGENFRFRLFFHVSNTVKEIGVFEP